MAPISYARHRFPPDVIRHAVWLYLRFTLSYRDVEELLAERGLDVSYETVGRWVQKFGLQFARNLRARRARPSGQWHLDEMVVSISGKHHWLWRAVDSEGEVLDLLVQSRRDKKAALRLMRKLLRKHGIVPTVLVTDKLRSWALRGETWVSRPGMSRVCARTTGPRIRISRSDDESGRCRASSRPDRPSDFSASTPRSTTRSTCNATSFPAARFACSGRGPRKRGRTRPSRHDGEDRPHEPCARAN